MSSASKTPMRVVKFTVREDIEKIKRREHHDDGEADQRHRRCGLAIRSRDTP
jgi:hypothetical protein